MREGLRDPWVDFGGREGSKATRQRGRIPAVPREGGPEVSLVRTWGLGGDWEGEAEQQSFGGGTTRSGHGWGQAWESVEEGCCRT